MGRWRNFSLFQPFRKRAAHLREFSCKKMVRVFDEHQSFWLRHSREKLFHASASSKLVAPALQKELWLRAIREIGEIRVINRNSEPDQLRHSRVLAADAQSHIRAEAESAEQNRLRWEFLRQMVERGAHVVRFAPAAVVDSLAQPRAAKIESQYGNSMLVQNLRHLEDDFVVHGAAEERMRMAHHGDSRRLCRRCRPEHRLQPAGWAIQEKCPMKRFGHGERRV